MRGVTATELTAVVEDVTAADGVRKVVGGVPIGGTIGANAPIAPGQEIDSTGYFSAEIAPCAAIQRHLIAGTVRFMRWHRCE